MFERSTEADALSDEQVKALKAATTEARDRITSQVIEALTPFEVWVWDDAWPAVPASCEDFSAHPRVSEILAKVGSELGELLGEHGLPSQRPNGEPYAYRLPSYFVAGHFMKSLVGTFWRAIGEHHRLNQRLGEVDQAEQRQSRLQRWEDA